MSAPEFMVASKVTRRTSVTYSYATGGEGDDGGKIKHRVEIALETFDDAPGGLAQVAISRPDHGADKEGDGPHFCSWREDVTVFVGTDMDEVERSAYGQLRAIMEADHGSA